jgi:ribonuclease P protein component
VIADTDAATFPPSVRVRTPKQYQATFSQGRRISAALFRLHVRVVEASEIEMLQPPARPGDSASERHVRSKDPLATRARLGISVSKRVAAHAVERNRIKRIARDSFRRLRLQLPPGDYVLLAQRDAAGASSEALRAALATLWQRAGALKTTPAAPTIPPRVPDSATDPADP